MDSLSSLKAMELWKVADEDLLRDLYCDESLVSVGCDGFVAGCGWWIVILVWLLTPVIW